MRACILRVGRSEREKELRGEEALREPWSRPIAIAAARAGCYSWRYNVLRPDTYADVRRVAIGSCEACGSTAIGLLSIIAHLEGRMKSGAEE